MEPNNYGSGTTIEEMIEMVDKIDIKEENQTRDYLLSLLDNDDE